ncbi:MAG: hypothetical protein AB8H80_20515 [Planctomycetota bacterium]
MRWLPLALVGFGAALPVVLYLLHRYDPVLAVQSSLLLRQWTLLLVLAAAALSLLGLLLYPPLAAGLRLWIERTRIAWSSDRVALQRAIDELKHFENAQRHLEVARLAWIRRDFRLLANHAPRAVAFDGQLPSARYLLGQHLLENHSYQAAAEQFAAAERLDQGHAFGSSSLLCARAKFLSGDVDGALAAFESHQREYGSSHRSNFFHGEALQAAGKLEPARRAFAEAAVQPERRLTAEENYYRAQARVRSLRLGQPTATPTGGAS